MTPLTETARPPVAARRALTGGIAAVAALVLAGAVVGARTLAGGETGTAAPLAAAHAHPHRVGEDITTGFGVLAVEIVDKSAGTPSRALAGATHYPGYVGAGQMSVEVTLNVRNMLARTTTISSDQFTLLSGKDRIGVRRASVARVKLQPDATFDDILSFTVPRDGRRMSLSFAETPSGAPILVDLGRAAAAADGLKGTTAAPGADDHAAHTLTPARP
jgi:hypothetical protein